ncbi:MAG: methyltransferase domain-containing protein [Thermodesulfobacteriota bacterium]|nr:methyltransferase domain-containing protein [Thermodesulfobacteriota bacterium]
MAERVCPVWVGYLLISPVRKLFQNPEKILGPYVKKGMKVLDIGCAMGFFSLPLARIVGSNGKVICADIQEKMIKSLEKRVKKAGLADRILTRICQQNSLGLDDFKEKIDFAFASAVVHEVPDSDKFFSEINETVKPGGRLLIIEPKGHVSKKDFKIIVSVVEKSGLKVIDSPRISYSHAALLEKNEG